MRRIILLIESIPAYTPLFLFVITFLRWKLYSVETEQLWRTLVPFGGIAIFFQVLYSFALSDSKKLSLRFRKYFHISIITPNLIIYSVFFTDQLYHYNRNKETWLIVAAISLICLISTILLMFKVMQKRAKWFFILSILFSIVTANVCVGLIRVFTVNEVYSFSTRSGGFERTLLESKGDTVEEMLEMHSDYLKSSSNPADSVLYRQFPKYGFKYWNWWDYYSRDVYQFDYLHKDQ